MVCFDLDGLNGVELENNRETLNTCWVLEAGNASIRVKPYKITCYSGEELRHTADHEDVTFLTST